MLQDFVDNSSESIISNLDTDSSGSIEPLELQIQKWNENGRLTFLWLYDDSLSGEIPESIGRLAHLKWLYIYWNQLSGVMPDSLCIFYPNLTNTNFAYNQFCPPYPSCIPFDKIGVQNTSNCL